MTMPETTSSVKELVEIGIDSFKFLGNTLGKDYQMFATKYNFALKDYFDAKIKTLGKIKQAFFTSKVVNFHDIYVPQDLKFNNQNLTQDEFLDRVKEDKRFVISATAGAGKSCMMRNLFLTIIKEEKPFFPLFFELRRVNNQHSTIMDNLIADIAQYNSKFSKENLEYILKRDNTILLLDGFDELNPDKKLSYISEINQLSELHPDLHIVISSRPEYGLFREWSLFNVTYALDLNINQAEQLIQKLNYQNELSERFINKLKSELFEEHKSFASNPLLLTIMLVTYEECGEIPNKTYLFYDEAFRAIFRKHDVTKQGYLRKRHTDLDVNQFKYIFSLFCYVTYRKNIFTMSESKLDSFLEKCIFIKRYNISLNSFKLDLLNSIPLLMADGLEYTFTHRSFQEYFTAYYLSISTDLEVEDYDLYFSDRNVIFGLGKNILPITTAWNMNHTLIEEKYILPRISLILKNLVFIENDIESKIKNCSHFISYFEVEGLNLKWYLTTSDCQFARLCKSLYKIDDYILKKKDYKYSEKDFIESLDYQYGNSSLNSLSDKSKKIFIEYGGYHIAYEYINILKKTQEVIKSRKYENKGIMHKFFD